ncbi:hypothetical protein K0U00_10610, partial [Paenibacillus sepulcri]|nr:hypothetical protein [Paenibacillus sepulcri]
MSQLLQWLRYLLLFVPAIVTLLTVQVESPSWFTLYVLLGLLMLRVGELYPEAAKWMMAAELIGFSLLAYETQGLMFMLLYSSLIAVFVKFRSPQAMSFAVVLGAALLGICMQH